MSVCTSTVILTSHLVAKLKAEATRIEMEAELTCQTKVSILFIIQSCYNLHPSLPLPPPILSPTLPPLSLYLLPSHSPSLPLSLPPSCPLSLPLSLLPPSLPPLFLQMQEAEVQFLREQNELQVKRAKDLSNIEVR